MYSGSTDGPRIRVQEQTIFTGSAILQGTQTTVHFPPPWPYPYGVDLYGVTGGR